MAEQAVAPPSLRPAALVTHPEFIAALLDSLADGIVACDADGRLVLFNRATEEWHGLPATPLDPSELAEHYDLFEQDGVTPLTVERIPLLRALAGEVVDAVPMVIAPHNGAARPVRATGRRITGPDGRLLGGVVAMHDETARLAALQAQADELAARGRAVRLRALQGATTRLLAVDSLQQAQDVLVEVAAGLPGATGATLVWHAEGELRRRLQVGSEEGVGHTTVVADGDEAIATLELRADGWDDDDEVLLEQLASVAGQVVRSLRLHHRAALAETQRLRDELLAAVSHEMQTPLAGILGLVAASSGRSLGADAQAEVLRTLGRQAELLRHLVQGFLDHARLAAGQALVTTPRHIDLVGTVRDVVALFDGHRRARVVDAPATLPLDTDPDRVSQVLRHLLDNAHRHATGPVEVAVAAGPAAPDGAERVEVRVRDHGPGLGADPATVLRAPATGRSATLDTASSGIGLSLCRHLAEGLGGTLAARNHPDGGAEFRLTLPTTPPVPGAHPRPAEGGPPC